MTVFLRGVGGTFSAGKLKSASSILEEIICDRDINISILNQLTNPDGQGNIHLQCPFLDNQLFAWGFTRVKKVMKSGILTKDQKEKSFVMISSTPTTYTDAIHFNQRFPATGFETSSTSPWNTIKTHLMKFLRQGWDHLSTRSGSTPLTLTVNHAALLRHVILCLQIEQWLWNELSFLREFISIIKNNLIYIILSIENVQSISIIQSSSHRFIKTNQSAKQKRSAQSTYPRWEVDVFKRDQWGK